MDRDEIADLLSFCSAFDNRKASSEVADAWTVALSAVESDEAHEAVVLHYRTSGQWSMLADILRILRERSAHTPPRGIPAPVLPDAGIAERGRAQTRAAAAARAENKARRLRVLGYPDLAQRLCEPPLSYPRAQMWNGFVPPRQDQEQVPELLHSPALSGGRANQRRKMTGSRTVNDSPRRTALVEICAEALRRDKQEGDVW